MLEISHSGVDLYRCWNISMQTTGEMSLLTGEADASKLNKQKTIDNILLSKEDHLSDSFQTSVSFQEEDGPSSAGKIKNKQKTIGVSLDDVDVVMPGKTSYPQEHEDCAVTECCSALTIPELEGTSKYSLNPENDLSVSEERKDETVSSGLDNKSDKTTFSANESNLHDCSLGHRGTESWNKVPVVKSGDTKSVRLGKHPVGVEKYQVKEEMVPSLIKDDQIVDEITEDGELADGPISPVRCGPETKYGGWSKLKGIFHLKMFVKKLYTLKKFNPPKVNVPQEEIVHLRHQELEGRKKAEEWTVDYTRKRAFGKLKSQLPVEPFETVQPLVEHDSIQMEASEAVRPSVDQESDGSIINETSRRLCTKSTLVWTLAATNIILEALSAAFDQLASPTKPNYALIGLLMSFIALFLCMGEFIYKARKARVVLRRWGFIWWLLSPFPEYEPFGSFSDIFGLICATFQCIFSIIQYAYFRHHAENPLKISLLPLIFAICVAFSRFHSRGRESLPHRHYP